LNALRDQLEGFIVKLDVVLNDKLLNSAIVQPLILVFLQLAVTALVTSMDCIVKVLVLFNVEEYFRLAQNVFVLLGHDRLQVFLQFFKALQDPGLHVVLFKLVLV